MKNNTAFGVLLIITIAATGFTVLYNLYLRQSFPVAVRYDFPAVHRAGESEAISAAENQYADPEDNGAGGEFDESGYGGFEYEGAADAFYEAAETEEAEEAEEPVSVKFPLDLNAATVAELKFIPQIGEVTAQRIVQYREYLGGYTGLEQLMEIKGIAEKTFERIAPYLYIE